MRRALFVIVCVAAPAAADPLDDDQTEVITVSGAARDREQVTGAAPISLVTRADIDAAGHAALGEILQSLPAQTNGANAQANVAGDGAARIDLRGLGAARTVVLLNGRRLVNGGPGADSSVDINAIPLAMIERIEVIKDGASTRYAADAIGGVVNIVTRPQFDGTDVTLLTSTSQRGDGSELDASFVSGFTAEDKLYYFVLSGDFQHHEPVLGSDRGFSAFHDSYDFASGTVHRGHSLVTPGGRLDAGGLHIPGCSSGICKPDGNGGWTDFVTPDDLYNEETAEYLYTPATRYSVIATAGGRINEHLHSFAELLYQRRNSDRELSPVPFVADAPISKDSIYNPFGVDLLDYRRRITELGPRQYLDEASLKRGVGGVRGDAFGWNYEAWADYGETTALANTHGQLYRPHVADSLGPSMISHDGTPICVRVPGDESTQIVYVVNDPPAPPRIIPCVPLNILAPTIPHDQLKNLTFTDTGIGNDDQRGVHATATRKLGALTLLVGGDYRSEFGHQDPGSVASSGNSTDNQAMPTDGTLAISEAYGEASYVAIPHRAELDLGARFLHHDHFGNQLVYKASGLYRTLDGIALRGTYATTFRAPTFFDLYGGRTVHTPAAEDPCDTRPPSVGDGTKQLDPMVQAQCIAQGVPAGSTFGTNQQNTAIGGNPDLKPETAATATLGVVVEPLRGLAVSADYWRIAIDNAIQTLGVATILANCYDRGIQAFCDQIHRDRTTHRIDPVDQLIQNVKRTTTSGIDLALWYDTRLDEHRLHASVEAQYLLRYDLATADQVIHGAGLYDLGAFPRFKANLAGSWTHGAASAGFLLRYISSFRECASNDCNTNPDTARDVGDYTKLDLYGSYDLPTGFGVGRTTVQLGINNAFDTTPPFVYNSPQANSDAATYDFIGRMVYLRLAQLF